MNPMSSKNAVPQFTLNSPTGSSHRNLASSRTKSLRSAHIYDQHSSKYTGSGKTCRQYLNDRSPTSSSPNTCSPSFQGQSRGKGQIAEDVVDPNKLHVNGDGNVSGVHVNGFSFDYLEESAIKFESQRSQEIRSYSEDHILSIEKLRQNWKNAATGCSNDSLKTKTMNEDVVKTTIDPKLFGISGPIGQTGSTESGLSAKRASVEEVSVFFYQDPKALNLDDATLNVSNATCKTLPRLDIDNWLEQRILDQLFQPSSPS